MDSSKATRNSVFYGNKPHKDQKYCKGCKKAGHTDNNCFRQNPKKYEEFLERKLRKLRREDDDDELVSDFDKKVNTSIRKTGLDSDRSFASSLTY